MKYCKDEAIDYDWVIKFKNIYLPRTTTRRSFFKKSMIRNPLKNRVDATLVVYHIRCAELSIQ